MADWEDTEVAISKPVVIDNGTGFIKVGFAGDDKPTKVFPSCVGRPKHFRLMGSESNVGAINIGDACCGPQRGVMKLNYPMEHGQVVGEGNWEDMEKIWQYAFKKGLGDTEVAPSENPVLLTEAPLNPLRNRARSAEIFFETFQVPKLYISMQAVLSLYASGRTTGVVLDVGDGVTHAVPVFEGFALPHSIARSDVAGREVTNYMQLLLRRAGYSFHTTAEKEVVREIKEATCYVAMNSAGERLKAAKKYKLPDENVIELGTEMFEAPEVLFNPEIIGLEYAGVAQTLVTSIQKADLDVRKALYSQIVLAGGSTLFRGFGQRLLNDVKQLAPAQDLKIRITAPPERQLMCWMGGSILASLSTFDSMCISKEEYDEAGNLSGKGGTSDLKHNLVHRKTF